jgi:hypothetical protein
MDCTLHPFKSCENREKTKYVEEKKKRKKWLKVNTYIKKTIASFHPWRVKQSNKQ